MPRPRTFDENDVVTAAREEFWSRGYAATSVDELTAATRLGKGSLYGAFGDKHRLFLRVLDDYIGTALETIRTRLRDPKHSAYDRLIRHIREQAKVVAADTELRGCMMAKSAAELSATDDDVERAVEHAYAAWRNELVDCIKAAQRDGDIDAKQNAQALATTVLAFMRSGGVAQGWRQTRADQGGR